VNPRNLEDLSSFSMLELFRVEAETQTALLTSGLLELERGPGAPEQLEILMRAAHSLKGAARIVNLKIAVRVAHAMEDCFVAAQQGKTVLGKAAIDVLLRGVDLLLQISKCSEANIGSWESEHATEIRDFLNSLQNLMPEPPEPRIDDEFPKTEAVAPINPLPTAATGTDQASPLQKETSEVKPAGPAPEGRKPDATERVLRLTAENLNRLLGLAGESLVESRWLRPFAGSLERLKRQHNSSGRRLRNPWS